MQPHQHPDSILQKYRDTAYLPDTHPNNVMIVGTGGTGLWERSWRRFAIPGQDTNATFHQEYNLSQSGAATPGPMRAMCIATDLSREYAARLLHLQSQHYSTTPDGRSLIQQLTKPLADLLPRHRSLVEEYLQKNPDHGSQQFLQMHTAAQDVQQIGKHILFLGILHEDPTLIPTGIRLQHFWTSLLQSALLDPSDEQYLLHLNPNHKPWPQDPQEASHAGLTDHNYFHNLLKACNTNFNCPGPETRSFLAQAIAARTVASINDQNVHYLHDLGAKNGGIPSVLRRLSDQTFSNEPLGICKNIEDSIANHPADVIQDSYRKAAHTQLAMIALAFSTHQDPPPPAERLIAVHRQLASHQDPAQAAIQVQELTQHLPPPRRAHNPAETLREALNTAARDELDTTAQNLRAGLTEHHHAGYHFVLACEIAAVLIEQHIPQRIANAKRHQEWQPFLQGHLLFHASD